MKSISFLLFVFTSYYPLIAQNTESIENKVTPINAVSVPLNKTSTNLSTKKNKAQTISVRAGESQVVHDNDYYLNEISKIDAQIQAINQKIQVVSNDETENELANNSGWFDEMDTIKQSLITRKTSLQSKLN